MGKEPMRTRQLDRHRMIWLLAAVLLFGAMFLIAGCGALAPLAQLIQPPRFEQADQPAEMTFGPMLLVRGEPGVR